VAYPATLDTLPLTINGVTDADELLFNGIIDALSRTQQYGGTTAEAPSSAPGASLSARLAAVEALAVGGSAPTGVASATHGPLSTTLSDADAHTVLAAPGAGLALYVTQIALWNSSSVFTIVSALEGPGGPTRLAAALAATAGAGFVKPYAPPWELPANTALVLQAAVAVSLVLVNLDFYVGSPSA
jgi:hypothetical protein